MPITTVTATTEELIRRAYFVQKFLEMVKGNQVFEQFAQQRGIPRGASGFPEQFNGIGAGALRSVEFTGYQPLDLFDDTSDIAASANETTSTEITNITTRKVNANIELYSQHIQTSSLLKAVALDREMLGLIELLADQLARSLDWIAQKLLIANAIAEIFATEAGVSDPNPSPPAAFGDDDRDIKIIGAAGRTTLAAQGGGATTTNMVAASENLVGGAAGAGAGPNWYTLGDFRIVKALLDAERALRFPGSSYAGIVPPAIETELLRDSTAASGGFIQTPSYAQAVELFKGEIGQIFGIRFSKTTEFAWIVGVQDDSTATEGRTDDGDETTQVDVGAILFPRESLDELRVSGRLTDLPEDTGQTYWQPDDHATLVNTTGPLIPAYVMGRDAFGLMRLEGENVELIQTQGADKADPTNLFSTIGYKVSWARAVLQARWIKVMLGAVEGRALSRFFEG